MAQPTPSFKAQPRKPRLKLPPDLIAEIAPTESARQRLLVDNPRRLYGFAA